MSEGGTRTVVERGARTEQEEAGRKVGRLVQHQVTRGQRRSAGVGIGGVEDHRAHGRIVPAEEEVISAGEGRRNRQLSAAATEVITSRTRDGADAWGERAGVDGVDRRRTNTEEREVGEVNRSGAIANQSQRTGGRAKDLTRGEPSIRIGVESRGLERTARDDFDVHARRQNRGRQQFHRATGQGIAADLQGARSAAEGKSTTISQRRTRSRTEESSRTRKGDAAVSAHGYVRAGAYAGCSGDAQLTHRGRSWRRAEGGVRVNRDDTTTDGRRTAVGVDAREDELPRAVLD